MYVCSDDYMHLFITNHFTFIQKGKEAVEHIKLPSLIDKFRDTSYIRLTLRFLGLLCDRQNRVMQNYFRVQFNNIKTVNMVSETCAFLQSFYVEVTKE